jgi:hypothetical protein
MFSQSLSASKSENQFLGTFLFLFDDLLKDPAQCCYFFSSSPRSLLMAQIHCVLMVQ